jgi:hypothetical protein
MSTKGYCKDLRDNSAKLISDSLPKASLVAELIARGLKGCAQHNKPQVLDTLRRTDSEGAAYWQRPLTRHNMMFQSVPALPDEPWRTAQCAPHPPPAVTSSPCIP